MPGQCLWGKSMQSAIGLGKTEDLIKWECVRYICIQRWKAQAFGAICMSTNKSPNLQKIWNVPRIKSQDCYRWHTRTGMKSLKKLIYPRCTHNLMKNCKMFLNASSRIFLSKTHGYIPNSLYPLSILCNSLIVKILYLRKMKLLTLRLDSKNEKLVSSCLKV